ncbi:uncharacterized protein LOC113048444 [Carassius auratus]|uniref:Uncharacterized protein LOC113048444 n=1 Tax=Carassius auratus TaxID=7957 RepID=A0A6P6K1K9_CARAU|nr:uncharacterized protein LOC113048444 [Carassius auratus]
MYLIVEFVGEGSTGPVAKSWYSDGHSWWPPYKDLDRLLKSVRLMGAPQPDKGWTKHQARILHESASFDNISKKWKRACYTSDISESENSIKRIHKKKTFSSDDELHETPNKKVKMNRDKNPPTPKIQPAPKVPPAPKPPAPLKYIKTKGPVVRPLLTTSKAVNSFSNSFVNHHQRAMEKPEQARFETFPSCQVPSLSAPDVPMSFSQADEPQDHWGEHSPDIQENAFSLLRPSSSKQERTQHRQLETWEEHPSITQENKFYALRLSQDQRLSTTQQGRMQTVPVSLSNENEQEDAWGEHPSNFQGKRTFINTCTFFEYCVLSVPHRRLVCCSRLFEVTEINKPQKHAAHQREVFLFNDLLVILKLCPKKKSSAAYTFCKALGLLGMQFHLFENEYYPHAITILSPCSGSDKKQVLNFCAQSAEDLLKFVEDLKESIAEVSEMEQIRIEWELEKQQGAKSHSIKNNGTLELRGRQGSPSGKQEMITSQSGHNAVEVSIHNRLQTYQLNAAPQSPESTAFLNHQREFFQQSPLQCASPLTSHSYQPVALAELRPDTLIQCQQIVKVIVLDKGGHRPMEAFLSQSPTHHQLIQSVVSTPVRSRDGGVNQGGNDGSQPPLPPPPPPYNHPHQYIPPDPRLALQRTPSGSRSLI